MIPRARLAPDGAVIPLEQRIGALLDRKKPGAVNLIGPGGSGKTVALDHLAAVFGPNSGLLLLDGADPKHVERQAQYDLVVFTSMRPADPKRFATFEIAPWSDVDLVEYLLATHRGRCRAVMDKLRRTGGHDELAGLPELWRVVLDEMAADESVEDIAAALSRFLEREFYDLRSREAAERRCLFELAPCGVEPPAPPPDERLARLTRHRPVKVLLAAERLVSNLCNSTAPCELRGRLPRNLIARAALRAGSMPQALSRLEELTRSADTAVHAMAASILHATGVGWRPREGDVPNLANAWLEGVRWTGVRLATADLRRADLCRAGLAAADLSHANLSDTRLTSASLRVASLRGSLAKGSDFAGADLPHVSADDSRFVSANFAGADLSWALLRRADFQSANLTNAVFRGADLTEADLRDARVDGADFSRATLSGAALAGLPLRRAILAGTCFRGANLAGCDLEQISSAGSDFSRATLSDALLTGSVLRAARFRKADLRNCGLADVDWEGADLRGADLRGATFHMGSTRSGLVGSHIPCEGSKTGFYSDDYHDREFKDPREYRKANLCGADLRNARIDGVDFYLVDLRGARYGNSQAEHFARCGAILCGR